MDMNPSGAFDHPLRRQILRVLIASDESLSAPQLAATLSRGGNVSAVTYHARVLESAGAVGRTRAGGPEPDLYRVGETPPELIALLEATREDDAAG